MANATETRNQHRATCPHCFAQQAIDGNGRLVNHGYTRPSHWHSNEGTCRGAGAPHFGTVGGRDYLMALANRLVAQADLAVDTAEQVLAGVAQVMTTKRLASRLVMEVVKDNPTARDREQCAAKLRQTAVYMREAAVEMRGKVAAWQPAEPVVVVVAVSSGPLVHYRGGYYGGKACASSAMGAMKGYAVRDLAHVTCDKCKAYAARQAAKAAAKVVA